MKTALPEPLDRCSDGWALASETESARTGCHPQGAFVLRTDPLPEACPLVPGPVPGTTAIPRSGRRIFE
ncbi:putative laminin beta 1a [Rhodovulum sulfidophilum]|uniref:Putative laminin beta 1a n=1 Tax=Rhodovulum sulfidophilum TaxID=35806 RepID=A0A0D6B1M6_RHOSU|nr:putative laminin beta 1a [Rhodovulum sulfidophilum]